MAKTEDADSRARYCSAVRSICAEGFVAVVVEPTISGSAAALCRVLGSRVGVGTHLYVVDPDDARAIFGRASLVADLIEKNVPRAVLLYPKGKVLVQRLAPDDTWVVDGMDLPEGWGPEDGEPGGAALAPA